MGFTAPDLSEILANEQELNARLTNLRGLLRNELDDLATSYSNNDSIKRLIERITNPPAWKIERSSTYDTDQLGTRVAVTGCDVYSWNKYNPTTYADSDYWYLQSLTKSSNATATAWGLFNTGTINPTDIYDLIVYGRGMAIFNNNAFSGVGFSYGIPQAGSGMTGFYIGITLDSGTYRPAYAIFNNSTTPIITKMDYGTYDSSNQKFRLYMMHDDDYLKLYWFKDNDFLWNDWFDLSDLPQGYESAELKFGYVSHGTGLGRMSYVPRLYLSSPCRLNVL
ncbi:MAG: hypothetical protein E7Z81_00300 [Methanobrevibacter sp.]|uniref:hypothetical protein n=1 Tax=Methanobrevibacter sp. TaxID=66852 RepID=UPI0025CCFB72|nr:hypothetical protein [Methanobrevibacter sp.]MBE6496719.1 hypothetical protein [Methanobrevibacter sp.]